MNRVDISCYSYVIHIHMLGLVFDHENLRVYDWWEWREWWIDDEFNNMWIMNWWYVEWDMHDELMMDWIIKNGLNPWWMNYIDYGGWI